MNNHDNRVIRLIVATGSLLAIIFIAGSWVDEYLELRRDSLELKELELEFAQSKERSRRINRIEAKLNRQFRELRERSVDPSKMEAVRETLVEIVRQAGGRVRQIAVSAAEQRSWAAEKDSVDNGTMPFYQEESGFDLHAHTVELQADGSLSGVRQIVAAIEEQGWLMKTQKLAILPTSIRQTPVSLELQFAIYGLTPRTEREPEDDEQDLATAHPATTPYR